jgi:hypothetical protein
MLSSTQKEATARARQHQQRKAGSFHPEQELRAVTASVENRSPILKAGTMSKAPKNL